MGDRADRPDQSGEIVNPEDLPAQIEFTEQAGVTRIDIAEDATTRPGDPGSPEDEHAREMSSPIEQLAPALDIDARLTEIERRVNLLVNVTPLNAAEAWGPCRSHCVRSPPRPPPR